MRQPAIETIRLPNEGSAGVYVAFRPSKERTEKGAKIALCNRCGKLVGHHPRDSFGHEIICLRCADDIPAIRQRLDQLAKARGE